METRKEKSQTGIGDSPGTVLIVGASREADELRCLLDDQGWPFVGLSDCDTARVAILAPHPFDCDLMHHGLDIAQGRGLPFAVLQRPGWQAREHDNWYRAANFETAAQIVRDNRWRHVLLAVGQERQPAFDGLTGCILHIRRQGARSGFDGRHEILGGSGPFSVAGERGLLRKFGIEAVVAHDSGGGGGWPKIEAARLEALPVVLIDRPARPDAVILQTPSEAISWLSNL